MVLAGAVIISSFAALTLAPMLSVRLLKKRERKPWLYRKTEPFFNWLTGAYERSLQAFLGVRWAAFAVLVGAGVAAYGLYRVLPSELVPQEDRGQIRMFATAPEGATYEYMDAYMDTLIAAVQEAVPELNAMISVTSPGFGAGGSVNSGFGFLILEEAGERERSQDEIAGQLSGITGRLTAARTFVSQPEAIGGGGFGGLPVQYVLQAPSIEQLREVLPRFLEAVRDDPAFAFSDVNLKFNKPELQVEIDRDRAQSLGISALDISRTLQLALGGVRYDYFIRDGRQYEVIGQVARADRDEPVDLAALYVRSAAGQAVPLGNLVRFTEQSSPPQIFHFNRYISATVSAQPAPGRSIGDGIEVMDRLAAEVLPPSFQTALAGQSQAFAESSSSLLYVFALALVLIYLVLAAQFESFRDPVVILLTVPLAVSGALLSLWAFGQTLNVFSQIGIIMLIGLITKNGILIVEFANQRKRAGLDVLEAVKEAAAARFRPVLMTALSTVLGILPIALALGAGSESRKPMGIAVVGGMLIGTAFTLYVIPAVYSYFSSEGGGPEEPETTSDESAPKETADERLVPAGAGVGQ